MNDQIPLDELNERSEQLSDIGVDIRNKLGPIVTLIGLIERYEVHDEPKIWKYLLKEKEQCKISVEYLKNIL